MRPQAGYHEPIALLNTLTLQGSGYLHMMAGFDCRTLMDWNDD